MGCWWAASLAALCVLEAKWAAKRTWGRTIPNEPRASYKDGQGHGVRRVHCDECACGTNEGRGQETNWIADHHGGCVAGEEESGCDSFLSDARWPLGLVVDREPIRSLSVVPLCHKPSTTTLNMMDNYRDKSLSSCTYIPLNSKCGSELINHY